MKKRMPYPFPSGKKGVETPAQEKAEHKGKGGSSKGGRMPAKGKKGC